MDHPAGNAIRFTAKQIKAKVQEIGSEITRDYAAQDLVIISVLKGSVYFLTDLTRSIDLPLQVDFISIGTYPTATNQTGIVRITKDLDIEITGKSVLLVEDIIRTGLTTGYLVQTLQTRMPKSIHVCTLLVNPTEQLINVPIRYYGFEISQKRVVGYGMDINEVGRNYPFIAEL